MAVKYEPTMGSLGKRTGVKQRYERWNVLVNDGVSNVDFLWQDHGRYILQVEGASSSRSREATR